jgi:hypothetical protein
VKNFHFSSCNVKNISIYFSHTAATRCGNRRKTMKLPPQSDNIRIQPREDGSVAVFFDCPEIWGGKNCFRKFFSLAVAEQFAAGEEITPAPEKGARVRITERAAYPGQDEPWTERQTGEEVLSAPITVYHFGRPAKSWRPQVTCFYREWPAMKAEIPAGAFIAEIPAGAAVSYFDDEVRVDLSHPGCKVWLAAQ